MKIERIQEVYSELAKYQLELHSDPISLGPKYLQDMIATCRNYINNVSTLLREVSHEKTIVNQGLRQVKTLYDIDYDALMSSDEQVKRQPNIKDRESLARTLLREQWQAILLKQGELDDLLLVEKAIKHHHGELRDTMADIRTQRGLIQSEISTGAMYGDERDSRNPRLSSPEDLDEDEIEKLLGDSSMTPKKSEPRKENLSQSPEIPFSAGVKREEPKKEEAEKSNQEEIEQLVNSAHLKSDEHIESFINGGTSQVEEDLNYLLE